jgi:hypothetical protein
MSTANLSYAQIERWRAKGYIVEVMADEGCVDVHKPEPKVDRVEYWHDEEYKL